MRKIILRSSLLSFIVFFAFSVNFTIYSPQVFSAPNDMIATNKKVAMDPEQNAGKMIKAKNEEKSTDKPKSEKSKKEPPATRGKMLYTNHCHACHESNVHIRAHRKVKKKADIEFWVNRWSTHLKLNWKESDRQQVIDYLNQTYYKFSAID